MSLRELMRTVTGEDVVAVVGIDDEAARTLRLGIRPQRGVYPLWRGAAAWALLGDDLEDYIDEPVLRVSAKQDARGVGNIVAYVRMRSAEAGAERSAKA